MKLALAQMKMRPDMEVNYRKGLALIREAADKGADLILFPEIQLTPFFPQYENQDVSGMRMQLDSTYITGICDACREKWHICFTKLLCGRRW